MFASPKSVQHEAGRNVDAGQVHADRAHEQTGRCLVAAPKQDGAIHRVAAKQSLGEWDWNLYWHTGGADQLHFYRSSFALWQELNLDKHSLIEDPLFVNSKVADFGLQPNSPAAKIDFRAIDIRHVGLYGEPSWIRQVGHSNCVPAPLPASHSR